MEVVRWWIFRYVFSCDPSFCWRAGVPGGDRYEGAFEVGMFHGYRVFHSASDMSYEVS